MPERKTIGTGITKREVSTYDMTGNTPGDVEAGTKAFIDQMEQRAAAFERNGDDWGVTTERARRACEVTLERAWPNYAAKFDELSAKVKTLPWWKVLPLPEDSPEWFAEKILGLLLIVDRLRQDDKGDPAALSIAFEAGRYYATARFKFGYESDIIKFQDWNARTIDNSKKGAAGTKERKAKAYEMLGALVQQHRQKFDSMRDHGRVRMARHLAGDYDRDLPPEERLFHRNGQLYRVSWFEDWLSNFLTNQSHNIENTR